MADNTAQIDAKLLSTLSKLGGQKVGEDALIFEGSKVIIPAIYRDDMRGYLRFLRTYMEGQEEETSFSKTFKYRPWDGAMALRSAMKRHLGIDIVGKATMSFFGKNPPALIDISIGYGVTDQIPWGAAETSLFRGTIHLGASEDEDLGMVFSMRVDTAKKNAGAVQGLFKLVEDELATASIYRGKAFTGGGNPEFLDTSAIDPSKVVYRNETMADIQTNVLDPIRHYSTLKKMGIPFKRAIALYGPWGTGKSLLAKIAAREAEMQGVTFLYCRPGKDDIYDVMRTARLYQPAVVFVEDIDVIAENGEADEASRLLDLFDGMQAKDNEVMVILTTNHIERVHKGMLRPGRLDSLIHIGAMDDESRERLVKAVVPAHLLDKDIDYAAVNVAMHDYMPAYVREAIDRAKRFSLSRAVNPVSGMTVDPDSIDLDSLVLNTDDLVNAAHSLRGQFDLMDAAQEGKVPPTLDTALGDMVQGVVTDVVSRTVLESTGVPFIVQEDK